MCDPKSPAVGRAGSDADGQDPSGDAIPALGNCADRECAYCRGEAKVAI